MLQLNVVVTPNSLPPSKRHAVLCIFDHSNEQCMVDVLFYVPSSNQHHTLIIEEFEPDVFRQLIEYIHTGCVTLQPRTLLGVMNAADYYGLDELRRACAGFVQCCINVDTVCALLASAERYIQYKCTKSLVQKVLEFVDEHGNEVLNLGSFTLLPQHVVRLILAREELRADEFTKFQAALMWSKKYCDSNPNIVLKDVIGNFLEYIQFHKIPANVLMREIHPLGIVPYSIIMNALAYQNKMEAYSSLGKDRVSVLLSNIVQTKMSLAVGFASRASIYDAVLTAYELSTAQCIVLALLHGLVNNDVSICSLLGTLSSNVQHLRSSYLKVWLKEDFRFDQEEIYRAFSTAAHFINAGLINVPSHVLKILVSIVDKYNVINVCKEEGDYDTLNLLKSLGVDLGSKSSPEDDSPATTATAEVVREENADSGQPAEVEIAQEETASPLPVREENADSGQPAEVEIAQEENASPLPNELSGATSAAESPQPNEEFVTPFLDSQSDYEEYDDNYDSSDYDELFSEETSDSDSNVETPDEEDSAEMNSFSVVIELAQAFVDSGVLERTAAQLQEEDGKTLLHRAAEEGSVRAVKALLQLGVEVDSYDQWRRTPAHVAATEGKLQALRALYHHGGANLMLVDNRGDSMLHSAADRGHYQVVRWLLRHGIDVEEVGRGGWRPLHRASQQGHLEIVRLLLDNGACPNVIADVGGTALHRAAWWDRLEVAHLLIARGANIDISDNRTDTPLHMAAKHGHLEMVRLLLDCGANPAIADRNNMTPHDWAHRNRRSEVAEFMVSRGVDY